MKKIFIILGLTVIFLTASSFSAFNVGNTVEHKEEGTRVSFWIPGFAFKVGSWFVPKHEEPELKYLLKKIKSLKIKVREGKHYENSMRSEYQRLNKKLVKQKFEELVTVYNEDANVVVKLKQNRNGNISDFVVLIDAKEEAFVYVKMRCDLNMEEISKLMQNSNLFDEGLDVLKDNIEEFDLDIQK